MKALDESTGITVTGVASIFAPPDVARVQIGVSSVRPDPGDARDAAAATMRALISTLRSGGVDEPDLRTMHIAVSEEFDYVDGKKTKRRFRAQNQLLATIRNPDAVGNIVDAAISAARDDVVLHGVSFEIEYLRPLQRQALSAAFEDALARAQTLAASTGLELGSVRRILEEDSHPQPFPGRMAIMAEAASTPVLAGEQEITARVVVTWSLA
jgi:uncharacterized protein YggE